MVDLSSNIAKLYIYVYLIELNTLFCKIKGLEIIALEHFVPHGKKPLHLIPPRYVPHRQYHLAPNFFSYFKNENVSKTHSTQLVKCGNIKNPKFFSYEAHMSL